MSALTATNNTVETFLPKDWDKPDKELFTGNQFIDAYLKGKSDQQSQNQKLKLEKFGENLDKAAKLIEGLVVKIGEKGIGHHKSFLRPNNIYGFDAIVSVKEDDYYDDKFEAVYDEYFKIKEENNGEFFNLDIMFMPMTKKVREDNIVCDGYLFFYEKR